MKSNLNSDLYAFRTGCDGHMLAKMGVIISVFVSMMLIPFYPIAVDGHLVGPDVVTKQVGEYEVRFQSFPPRPQPGEPATLAFSVLDRQGFNLFEMRASVELVKEGETVFEWEEEWYPISDIFLEYEYPEAGQYTVKFDARFSGQSEVVLTEFPVTVGNSAGGECLIATAAFGSELSPQVRFLRDFRDTQILTTVSGSSFMNVFNAWYYSFSPYVADFEREQPWFRSVVRISIYPLLGILEVAQLWSSPFEGESRATLTGLVAATMIGGFYLAPFALLFKPIKNGKFNVKMSILIIAGGIFSFFVSLFLGEEIVLSATTSILILSITAVSASASGSLLAVMWRALKSI